MNILKVLTEKRKTGNIGEVAAAKYLLRHRYRILERNYVTDAGGEIDIIATNNEYYVFVEVKTRTIGHENPKEPRPASAVTPEKQRKIIASAKWFLGSASKGKRIRFDIIEVYLDENKKVRKITHLESAFNYNSAHAT